MTVPHSEKRGALRKRTLKSANIVFNGRQSVITCIVRNSSSTGALVTLPSVIGLPSTFEICIDGIYRAARVVWRSKMNLGIAWTG